MTYNYPEQRISISSKLKEDWYKNNADYWINVATSTNDKKLTSDNLDAANGIANENSYKYVLKPLSADIDESDLKKLPGEIRKIEFITPIKEKNIGEYIELPYNYLVKLNDPDISAIRNHEVGKKVAEIVDSIVAQAIEEVQQGGEGQIDAKQLQVKVQNEIDNYFDEKTTKVENLIEYINDLNDFENLRIQGFYYWWATEEVYFYAYIKNGNVYFENIDPTKAYPILSGAEFVEEGDGFVIIEEKSLTQYLRDYGNELSKKDIEYITHLNNQLSLGESYTMPSEVYMSIYGKVFADEHGQEYGANQTYTFNTAILKEYTIFFKTEIKKKLITRINELGQLIESQEEEEYVLNPDNGDIDEKVIWIEEVWKQVRIGERNIGIYLKPEPVDVQVYSDKHGSLLPVFGKKGLLKGININPIPKRIMPSMILYWIINLHIERQLAKYKTPVEVIPKGLLSSMDGDIKANWFYKQADSTIIYDESKFSPNELAAGYQIIGNNGLGSYIRDLIDLRDRVKMEAWDLANMNDSRYGQAAASSTVRNNEQNIYRAKLGSLLMVTIYNNILSKVHNYTSELAKIAYNNGLSASIIDRKSNRPVYFNIKSGELSNSDLGIFVINSILEKQKLDSYKDLAFSASQNGDAELASETINADSSSEVRKLIKEFQERKRQYEEAVERRKQESAERIAQINQETEKLKADNKIKEIEKEQELITERELKLAEINKSNNNN